jgi:hypothetical protein
VEWILLRCAHPASATLVPRALPHFGRRRPRVEQLRLQIGRVEGDQIYQLDTWRETLPSAPRWTPTDDWLRRAGGHRLLRAFAGVCPASIPQPCVVARAPSVRAQRQRFMPRAERAIRISDRRHQRAEEARLTFFGVAPS